MSFTSEASIVVEALERYGAESVSRSRPVIRLTPMNEIIEELDLARWVSEGGLNGEALRAFLERYLAATTRLQHPSYLAHQVAVPHPTGALAALVDGFTNNPMGIYEMGPAAATIEFFMVNWLLERVGWTPQPVPGAAGNGADAAAPHGAGVLTHGGSLANLTALAAARSHAVPSAWEDGSPPGLALIAPASSHYSVARAAGILGIGSRAIYHAEVDTRDVIRVDRLPALLDRVLQDGRRPVALVANACGTAVGTYDPLREIGAFCRERGLWFHVDGAHGATALLSPKHRHRLDGVETADSLVWDAHKMMRAPGVCAAVLVRDRRTLDGAFQQEASYLFHEKHQPGFDFMHRSVECTKAGLGLKIFAVLAALGERGLADYVDGRFALAREACEHIRTVPGFECPVEPESNILCFHAPGDDAEQIRLRDRLIADGDFHLSTTLFRNRRHLRLVFMHPESSMDDVRRLMARLRELQAEP
ncbi:MAG: aminotransferase class V-fold PLP-dependent enzyme [Candidatus Eisenbacteria bacterium]|nr:aminotransferase class V-fold PLP-dependent enzyme [Candidatus Eisenbacteria bacterium]